MRTKLFALFLAIVGAVSAQSPAPKFDVVSIKPCAAGQMPSARPPSPGRVSLTCYPLDALIRNAWIIFGEGKFAVPGRLTPLENAPGWVNSSSWTIEATVNGDPGQMTMMGPMMRAVLEDRFQFRSHFEPKEGPVYALIALKSGPKLQPAKEGNCFVPGAQPPPRPVPGQPLPSICKGGPIMLNGFDVRGVTLAEFATRLGGRLDRDVIDKTEITGTYDFISLTPSVWSGAPGAPGAAPPPPPPAGPPGTSTVGDAADVFGSIQTALQKFGLKLESARGNTRIFIIDHIERPTPD